MPVIGEHAEQRGGDAHHDLGDQSSTRRFG